MAGSRDEIRLAEGFPMSATLGDALRDKGMTIAVAESCTGGLLGAALTAVPGASDYMLGGVIAYADAVKSDQLGVSRHLIAEHGAVSEQVATAMAEGVRQRLAADIGAGITGVAGPGGGGPDKPAGLGFVAVAWAGGVEAVRLEGDHGRETNRVLAVERALELCLRVVDRIGGGSRS